MDIDELCAKKVDLENNLTVSIRDELERFHKETGISVQRITVEFVNVTSFSEKRGHFIVSKVECDIII